ncbi:hypothetical protein B0F90DRAFT_1638400 [Multifurca ochricompacta]|uniref:PLD phosphodiesterase domain-containing protein n=1 Tax=Multifurca ochricompacta TaxID=376703 RepID=A0AAD4M0N2_9AGAM|nr:hypothetical protein B0F90DRAFT_1638400 [Multifurca ochricompacta]
MVSRHVLELCISPKTLISTLAKEPDKPASRIVKQLFKNHGATIKNHGGAPNVEEDADELDLVAKCGRFPHRPSDLFLQIYKDVLHILDIDPLAGQVSPSLLGNSGVIPLSVVSVIPDIMNHYADLIVHAEAEIFLATNYWERSLSSDIIAGSLRKLSERVQARGAAKVVMKLIYDRGNVKQAVKHRILVKPVYWSRIGLPTEDEIPGIALEVINYHRPLLGTFHAKYLVVDRRVACLNSNNVQDRPNIEMMVHLEGPIVDSIYDMALMSWSNAMNPPLPLLAKPPTQPDVYSFKRDNENLKYIDPDAIFKTTCAYLHEQHVGNKAQGIQPNARGRPQRGSSVENVISSKCKDFIVQHPNMQASDPSSSVDAMGCGSLKSKPENLRDEILEKYPNMTPLLRMDSAKPIIDTNLQGQDTDDANANDSAQSGSGGSSDRSVLTILATAGTFTGSHSQSSDSHVQGDDGSISRDFCPHILHEPHKPVPIAMVNRCPTGTPGHYYVRQFPQDVAWLSAVRYAQKSVFIQTPTFNASPIVSGTLDACRRGVQVTLYLDLGFNDQGEMIPFQGGTNEEVVHRMYTTLNSEGNGAEKHLEVFWYTAKDQTKPLNAAMRKRNCMVRTVSLTGMLLAVKFMSVDNQIAILGSGNQDTQSWFHSQEVNIMVDSAELVSAWLRGIDANQNTRLYGRVSDKDGVWRSQDGEVVQASGIAASSFFKRLKGLGSVISRIRGIGGF